MKNSYAVKVNNGNGEGFLYVGMENLDSSDSDKKKDKEITRIRKKYDLEPSDWLNISNFFNVYC